MLRTSVQYRAPPRKERDREMSKVEIRSKIEMLVENDYIGPIRDAFVWVLEDNGHQERLGRFRSELNNCPMLSPEAADAFGHVFGLEEHRCGHLRQLLDFAKESLQQEIQSTEEKLARLKGEDDT